MTSDSRRLVESCETAALDIVHPFSTSWFNHDAPPGERLPDFGRVGALAFVVGNTRRLWPTLKAAVQRDRVLAAAEHPLDAYVTRTLDTAVAGLHAAAVVLYGHITSPRVIPLQRIADRGGLAHLGPAFLSVHPIWGPWFGLRAVVVVDAEGPPGESRGAPNPCSKCQAPCVPALVHARGLVSGLSLDAQTISRTWRAWLSARDACPVGREHRYDADQTEYHYTKRRDLLVLPGCPEGSR